MSAAFVVLKETDLFVYDGKYTIVKENGIPFSKTGPPPPNK